MTINFNVSPYYDDYSEEDKYLRVLFRPGFPVQARELTQLQSILQNQVSRFGDHVFKQGAMVLPGQISFDDNFDYVTVQPTFNGVSIDTYIEELTGYIIVGNTTGVKAKVVYVAPSTETDSATIYIKYLQSGTNNTTKTFSENEILTTEDAPTARAFTTSLVDAVGVGSAASIERGVYYVNGFFILVEPQTVLLDKYTNTPSYRVGLSITESIVTPEEVPALQDNAQGSSNFAAPGAHRYQTTLTLTKRTLATLEDKDFVELLRVSNGQIQYKVRTTDYSVLEETLARRTFDESGNYVVRNFPMDVREHRNNNRGLWTENTSFIIGDVVYYTLSGTTTYYTATTSGSSGAQPPIHTTGTATDGIGGVTWKYTNQLDLIYNRGVFDPTTQEGSESKLALGMEPGKAYVQGYEIEKIGTEYVTIDKARDFARVGDTQVQTTVGNYIRVTNINNIPRIDLFQEVDLYNQLNTSAGTVNGTKVGTARVRGIELESLGATRDLDVYKLQLSSVSVNDGVNFNRQVKQIYYNAGSTVTNFTADIAPAIGVLTGSVTASSSTTLTGTGTRFTTELQVGDYIYVGTSATVRRIATITNDLSLTVDANVTATGAAIYRLSTSVNEPENSSLIFPLPFYAVRKLRSVDDSTVGTSYTVTQRFVQTSSTGSGGSCTLTINAVGSVDTFGSAAESDNYLLIDNTSGAVVIPTNINVVSPSLRQVIFTMSDTYASTQFIILAAVRKTSIDAKEKTKTLTTATLTITVETTGTAPTIKLGKADGYRVTSVKLDTGSWGSPTGTYTNEIGDYYTFDDGQRDDYYDLASLTLKQGYPTPSAPIQITFEYFEHGTGDYFSVDSYTGSGIRYEDIPSYNGNPLRDSLDFRPRIDNTGVNFSSAGSSTTQLPKRGINVETDMSYYLSRRDKIAIDFNGNFFQVKGVPSVNPAEPEDPKNAMVLYKLSLEPYTFSTTASSVSVKSIDNRRYTMRDIGSLEKRIDTLEYYTSLSLLEQETVSLNIPDDAGLDRFKNGFIVDGFNGHGVGDATNPDYNCSIDMENRELRPFYRMDNVNLIEKNSTTAQRTADNYAITGDVVTLPYTNIEFIKQAVASRTENINPFAIFTFIGNIQLNPSSDDWFEVDRRPDIVNNVEGNFNTIATLAERAGVLGTVWNAWQNQWTGASSSVNNFFTTGDNWANARALGQGATFISISEAAARFGNGNRTAPARQITTQTTATQVGQGRSGVRSTVVAQIDRQFVDDKVLSTAVIPFMRSRGVLIQAKGFKPLTKLYSFFDSIDINSYIQPATRIAYNSISGFGAEFDTSTNVGSISSESARRIDGDATSDTQAALNKGDVVTGSTSGATGICVGYEISSTGSTAVYVLNIKGTFQSGETIIGSISGARGTISTTVVPQVVGDSLISNFNGDVYGLFTVPNTDSLRFRCGTKELRITDSITNGADFTSRGITQYRAQGILETKQSTFNAVRNATIAQEVVNQTRTITETAERVVGDTGWYDPLAQTFLVQQKGGAFLTAIDIFFATKDDNIPVNIEIREVVNGYPGKKVLPFSKMALNPDKVSISTNTVTVDEGTGSIIYPAPDTPTRFTFPSPVFVDDATEYCIVLSSDSNNYRAWISQMGDRVAGTDRFISEQPYAGVFFKSQNASTWTADQMQDLMFTIYRARFNTSVIGQVDFVNDILPNTILESDPFQVTSGSNKVRVFHPNHDMFPSSKVRIQNVATGTYNNIPSTELNATHTISDIDLDSYTITVSTNATATGFVGGSDIQATDNVQFDAIQPAVQVQNFSETTSEYFIKSTSGRSVDGIEVPYITQTTGDYVLINQTNQYAVPRVIASETNETSFLSGDKSVTFSAQISSTNDSLSPVIDTHRTSLICIHNKVNNATQGNTNISPIDNRTVVSTNTNVAITSTGLSTADSATKLAFLTMGIGRYITISGSSTSSNNSTFLITNLSADGATVTLNGSLSAVGAGDSITVVSSDKFYDEIAPYSGSQYSKYVTRRINLANPSSYFKIRMAVNVPTNADIDVYYKLNNVGSNIDFATIPYTLIAPDSVIPKTNSPYSFVDIEYSAQDLTQFDAIAVKLVFRSTNSAEIARVKDLRIIACA
jgi:hypothetical protein